MIKIIATMTSSKRLISMVTVLKITLPKSIKMIQKQKQVQTPKKLWGTPEELGDERMD
jgi:hypothetical protein